MANVMDKVAFALRDVPVKHPREFVDRSEDVAAMDRVVRRYRGSIIGVAGERGVGKTSFFNVWAHEGLVVRIMNRESPSTILADLIMGLAEGLGKRYLEALRELKVGLKASLSLPPSASVEIERVERALPFRRAVKKLRELLEDEGDLVIVLDEIDKEQKEELVRVVDAIKYAFEGSNTTAVVALPPVIYEEYLLSKAEPLGVPNLENIFSYIYLLPPMTEGSLREILEKRLGDLRERIDEEAVALALSYANGNPRQFLSTLREATLYSEDRVDKAAVEKVVRKYLSAFLSKLRLSDKEWQLISLYTPNWDEFVERVEKNGLFTHIQSLYTYVKRMEAKGVWKRKNGTLALNPRLALALSLGIRHHYTD